MRGDRTRLARRGLVVVVLAVTAATAWNLLRPSGSTERERPAAGSSPPPQATTVGDLVFVRFRAGESEVSLRARAMVGQEGAAQRFQGVEVALPYLYEGEKRTLTINADECLFQPEPQRANFKGHVRTRTDDGFELDSETLRYHSQPSLEVRTDGAVAFRRGKASGTAGGLYYRKGEGVQLLAGVRLRLEEEAGPPTDIEAASASASREQGFVWFEGGVVVRQGQNELRAARLQLNMTADFTAIERAAAIEDADLRLGASGVPGVSAGGEKRLRGRRINIGFRSKGVLEGVSAVNPASLEILSGADGERERRLITTSALHLLFDEQGRLAGLNAQSGGPSAPPEQRRTVVILEPAARGGAVRRVESSSLRWRVVSGAPSSRARSRSASRAARPGPGGPASTTPPV
jgi:hypothetical protein